MTLFMGPDVLSLYLFVCICHFIGPPGSGEQKNIYEFVITVEDSGKSVIQLKY